MTQRYRTAIVWFRRDLRIHDAPALAAACRHAEQVVPVFVFDDALLGGRWPSVNRIAFMRAAVAALGDQLLERGGRLVLRRGRPAEVIPALAEESGAEAVFVTRDYGPYARRRDAAVAAALGRPFHARPGLLAQEPETVLTKEGRDYGQFGQFFRTWDSLALREMVPVPEALSTPSLEYGHLPDLGELVRGTPVDTLPDPTGARDRLERWLAGPIDRYGETRNALGIAGTSRFSQDLHWGLTSVVEIVARGRARQTTGAAAFVREMAFRDFYHHVLFHHPEVTRGAFRQLFAEVGGDDSARIAAWQEGRTGYPAVDAAMRQLRALGWMHNRARMIVASFLTKHLLIDYRHGEQHFMDHLTDGDLALNNGGWQWAASTGSDAQPFFRVFNPTAQATAFDPDGAYVRHWLPELANVPAGYLHEPWTMPPMVQQEVGCIIGRDYPVPIVDHATARAEALAAYRAARKPAD